MCEPGIDDTITILLGLKEKYEKFHNVVITDESIISAVKLSSRYLNDRFQPDKSIDLIDEACSFVKINNNNTVNKSDIEEIISLWSGVPISKVSSYECLRFNSIEKKIKDQIIGQDEAVEAVCNTIKRGRTGFNNPNRL